MTTTTSSRSAKATPKTAAKQASNGTQSEEIEPPFESISETVWTVTDSDGAKVGYRLEGDGRISYSRGVGGRGTGELRIYRDATTKVYDAVVSDVREVISQRVTRVSLSSPYATAPTPTAPIASSKTLKRLAKLVMDDDEQDDDDDSKTAFSIGFHHKKSW